MSVVMDSINGDIVTNFSPFMMAEDLKQNKKPEEEPQLIDGQENLKICNEFSSSERIKIFQSSWESESFEQCQINNINRFHENDLYVMKLMGRGAFSDVHRACMREDSDIVFAIKRLNTSVMADQNQFQICVTDFALETAILSTLNHENIIPLHGVAEGNMVSLLENGKYFIVLELLSETLHDRFKSWRKQQKRQMLSSTVNLCTVMDRLERVVLGIARAMEYLHSNRIIYRDMKPKNVGFCDSTEEEVKLFDFGFARFHDAGADDSRLMTGGIGTPRYMAPEVARHDVRYSFSADVYSFSIMLWQIVTSRVPFREMKSASQLAAKVIMGNKRPRIGLVPIEELRRLIEAGWSSNPADRPTFSEIRERLEKIIKNYYCLQQDGHGLHFLRRLSTKSVSSTDSSQINQQNTQRRKTMSRRLSGSLVMKSTSSSAQRRIIENEFNQSIGSVAWSTLSADNEGKKDGSDVSSTISEKVEDASLIENCKQDSNELNFDVGTRALPFFQRTNWRSKRRNSML